MAAPRRYQRVVQSVDLTPALSSSGLLFTKSAKSKPALPTPTPESPPAWATATQVGLAEPSTPRAVAEAISRAKTAPAGISRGGKGDVLVQQQEQRQTIGDSDAVAADQAAPGIAVQLRASKFGDQEPVQFSCVATIDLPADETAVPQRANTAHDDPHAVRREGAGLDRPVMVVDPTPARRLRPVNLSLTSGATDQSGDERECEDRKDKNIDSVGTPRSSDSRAGAHSELEPWLRQDGGGECPDSDYGPDAEQIANRSPRSMPQPQPPPSSLVTRQVAFDVQQHRQKRGDKRGQGRSRSNGRRHRKDASQSPRAASATAPVSRMPRRFHVVEETPIYPGNHQYGTLRHHGDVWRRTIFPSDKPVGRVEVRHTNEALNKMLDEVDAGKFRVNNADDSDHDDAAENVGDSEENVEPGTARIRHLEDEQAVYDIVMNEIARQIWQHSNERGALLERVIKRYRALFVKVPSVLQAMNQQIINASASVEQMKRERAAMQEQHETIQAEMAENAKELESAQAQARILRYENTQTRKATNLLQAEKAALAKEVDYLKSHILHQNGLHRDVTERLKRVQAHSSRLEEELVLHQRKLQDASDELSRTSHELHRQKMLVAKKDSAMKTVVELAEKSQAALEESKITIEKLQQDGHGRGGLRGVSRVASENAAAAAAASASPITGAMLSPPPAARAKTTGDGDAAATLTSPRAPASPSSGKRKGGKAKRRPASADPSTTLRPMAKGPSSSSPSATAASPSALSPRGRRPRARSATPQRHQPRSSDQQHRVRASSTLTRRASRTSTDVAAAGGPSRRLSSSPGRATSRRAAREAESAAAVRSTRMLAELSCELQSVKKLALASQSSGIGSSEDLQPLSSHDDASVLSRTSSSDVVMHVPSTAAAASATTATESSSSFKQAASATASHAKLVRPTTPDVRQDIITMLTDSRFGKMLPSNQQSSEPRHAKPVTWLIRSIDSVYDAWQIADEDNRAQPLPEFLFHWASQRYGVPELVNRMLWDIVIAVSAYRSEHLQVEMFGKFLQEDLDHELLILYLTSRVFLKRQDGVVPNKVSYKATQELAEHVFQQKMQLPLQVAEEALNRFLGSMQSACRPEDTSNQQDEVQQQELPIISTQLLLYMLLHHAEQVQGQHGLCVNPAADH